MREVISKINVVPWFPKFEKVIVIDAFYFSLEQNDI